ncbi:hypothetical protein EX227_15050 [Providencia rettgeri]|uniref:Uncharacterized protein n=2 Tax=Providencia TaxID=586 RepID=A0AAP2NUR2_PRORE|nr:hypothetical protein [Providencia rettgeri]MBC8654027.1 hypothetical protein [Providencia vermicola]EIU9515645.1 hypothetical protein [Providencia rettgeri]EJD6083054.1 hypothetical protein [Providencia rettgeri]EJD6409304.1 hypothetical protein [Providencia rettgeri]
MMNAIQLEITPQETNLSFLSNKITLPIGSDSINGFKFQHSPITPYEAEIAIELIENTVIPARKQLSINNPVLINRDNKLKAIWQHTGNTEYFLTTQQIESAFNELVNVINGSPINSTTLPTDTSFTAFLIIIRELTHHWELDGIYLK